MIKQEQITLKKTSVWFVVVLSVLTLGIYIGYWFLTRKAQFDSINTKNYIPKKWWIFATFYLSLSFLFNFLGAALLTEYGLAYFTSIDVILSTYFLALLYYSVFRAKELLEQYQDEIQFSSIWTVLFHIWYLQYKINKIDSKDFLLPDKKAYPVTT